MSLRVVTMAELRLEVLLEPERTGDSVAEVCRRRGISRDTFYEYKRRYKKEGVLGLEPRPRRPVRSPRQMDVDLEVEICQMRGGSEPSSDAPASTRRPSPPSTRPSDGTTW